MEMVEGESLASRLAGGKLPLAEAVRLGREIAQGLAAAHARGILHRDLKAENVMITEEGSAKILDFGLAKRMGTDVSLTEDHKVLGTFRSMSPEQARGLPLDPRSDLFSLGVLLYEMLSGRSPFESGTALETLTRICTVRQKPLRDVEPGVPEGLSNLIDHLLEKDPALRLQSAREVTRKLGLEGTVERSAAENEETWIGGEPFAAPEQEAEPRASQPSFRPVRWRRALPAVALTVLALGLGAWIVRLARPEPLHVAVMKPEIVSAGREESVHRLAAGLRPALLRGLTSLEGVYPLAPEQVDPVSGPPLRVAKLTAAGEAVTSRLDCGPAVCQLSLARVSGRDGSVLWSQSIELPVDKPYLMAEAVEGHLRLGYPGHRARRGGAPEVRPEDYAGYLALLRQFEQSQQEELSPGALARLAAIRRSSPRFLEAFFFEAAVLQRRFQFRREAADLDRAAELLTAARNLAPDDPRPLQGLFDVAMKAQKLDRARGVLDELERLQPGSYEVMTLRARLLEQEGKADEALELIREVARRNPSWRHLYWAARMTYRNGHTEEGRRYLEDLLARFPEYSIGKSLLGEWELLTGSPERAVELYTELVRSEPGTTELVHLGLAYLLLNRYPEAEERFEQALAASPENPLIALNLADVLLLQGKKAEAESLYRQILSWIEKDPGASQVQLLSVKGQALAHLGRGLEAAGTAQQMLRIAPDDPQVALDLALIYTLIGDRSSARTNARRALEGGVEPRWFSFPWFAPLHASPELQDLLQDLGAFRRGPR